MLKKWLEIPLAAVTVLFIVFTVAACVPSEPAQVLVIEPLPAAVSASPEEDLLLDLNTATASELDDLPGIGPALAERILAWREENGAFTSPEDILSVSGIGQAKLEAIEPYITY